MDAQELPVVFDCDGSTLLGMIHIPAQVLTRGVVSVVAGGPQYRGGVCRLQVQLARELAANGTPVMRFDYRGLGDSEGEFRGFRDVEADLRCAIEVFVATVPGLKGVVLWGGCDAASAVLINAWKYPQVTGLVLGNPWVHAEDTAATVEMQHYGQRWKDPSFWKKVIRLQYNPLPALRTIGRRVLLRRRATSASVTEGVDAPSAPFVPRMCHGMSRFKGDLLLLMSGRSLLSREFDVLVQQSPSWQQAMKSPRHIARHELPDADQAFSTAAARADVIFATNSWLHANRLPSTDLS